jgi:hypothetical protein
VSTLAGYSYLVPDVGPAKHMISSGLSTQPGRDAFKKIRFHESNFFIKSKK